MSPELLTEQAEESSFLLSPTHAVSDTEQPVTINPGSAIATLWILTSQDNQPPASTPCPVLPISTCPRCNYNLSSALKPSGLQSCLRCGWIG